MSTIIFEKQLVSTEMAQIQLKCVGQHEILSQKDLETVDSYVTTIQLAKYLAAKIALNKCLIKLNLPQIQLCYISLLHDDFGKPFFSFENKPACNFGEMALLKTDLSLSDQKTIALAYVVCQSDMEKHK